MGRHFFRNLAILAMVLFVIVGIPLMFVSVPNNPYYHPIAATGIHFTGPNSDNINVNVYTRLLGQIQQDIGTPIITLTSDGSGTASFYPGFGQNCCWIDIAYTYMWNATQYQVIGQFGQIVEVQL